MTSRLPSLRAVAIFVAAGRALSFTDAAKTVNLTPSAVSRRIRALERELGTALFRRFNRRLELTPAGARYLAGVSQAIDLIERESDAIRPRRRGATLRLSVLQSFASLWLLPRLAAFKSVRPDIDVQVETSTELVDLVDERFDAAIRFGNGRWPGLLAEPFPVRPRRPRPAAGRKPVSAADKTTCSTSRRAPDPAAVSRGRAWRLSPRRGQTFDNAQVVRGGGHGSACAEARASGRAPACPDGWSRPSATSRWRSGKATISSTPGSGRTSRLKALRRALVGGPAAAAR
jgi:LysR family glycine cleavage system transcriptional activator